MIKTGDSERTIRKVTKTVNRKFKFEEDWIRLDCSDIQRIFAHLLNLNIIECRVTYIGTLNESEWDYWYTLA